MKKQYYLAALAAAAILVPGAVMIAHADDTSGSTATSTIEARLTALETQVADLTDQLAAAKDHITTLENKVAALEEAQQTGGGTSGNTNGATTMEPTRTQAQVTSVGVGSVLVCHNAHTLRIGIPALRAHLQQGDTPGECAVANVYAKKYGWGKPQGAPMDTSTDSADN